MMFSKKILTGLVSLTVLCASISTPAPAADAAVTQPELAEVLCEAWESFDTSVNVSAYGLTSETYVDAIYNTYYANPYYFHMQGFGASLQSGSSSKISKLTFQYGMDEEEYAQKCAEIDARVQTAVSVIDDSWSEVEIAMYLHDWLACNGAYDLDYNCYNAYNMLVDGLGVCQASSLSYIALARAAGLEAYMITSDELVHAWCVVKVDGQWYHVDVSNDDGLPDVKGYASHRYLLKSTEYMMADSYHAADDWCIRGIDDAEVVCDSTKYDDYFWNASEASFDRIGDGWFVVTGSDPSAVSSLSQVGGTYYIYRYDSETDSFVGTQIHAVKDYWSVKDGSGSYRSFLGFNGVYDGLLYYSTSDVIYRMNADGSSVQAFYTLTEEEREVGSIYGLHIDENGVLYYDVRPSLSTEDTEILEQEIQLQTREPEQTTTTTEETTTVTEPETTTTTAETTTSEETTTTTTTAESTTTTEETTTTTYGWTETTTAVWMTTTTTTTTETSTTTTTTTTESAATESTTTPESTTTTTTQESTTTTETTTTTTTAESTTTTTPLVTTTATTTTTTATTTTTTTTAPPIGLRGDVLVDQAVTIADVVLLARYVSQDKEVSLSGTALINADCDRNGSIDAEDITQLSLVLCGLSSF
ncbi:MAG: hypothetical protein E7501_01985 [Ruminococcus sp.]|nr:hypothetical protein [Ruminococcus sp.]